MLELQPPSRRWGGHIATTMVWSAAVLVVAIFVWIVGDLLAGGLSRLSWSFLTEASLDAGRAGGIGPMIVSTALILAVCLAVSVPIGLATAVMLSEFVRRAGWLSRTVRWSLDILAGVPSIVFGLFGNVFFCQVLGLGFSIWSGGLTLACMVLPIFIRSAEVGFRSVPDAQRNAAAALAMSRFTTLWRVLLPGAMPGVIVGLVLGVGRAGAETAALIFTSGYVDRMPESLSDSGRSLSVHIFDLSMNVPGGDGNAYASALVLAFLLLVINLAAALVGARFLKGSVVNV
ncbi:MAG: phosphate ABC transporter permease PstA [Planctomycetota bacterium]